MLQTAEGDRRATVLFPQRKKIHVIYDPPHLLKNIRNNMKNNGFVVNNVPVLWSHIEELYRFDTKNSVRLVPKLTDKLIYLPPFSALRVRFATQVLSHSVAAGLSVLIQLHVLPEVANETASFVEEFDKLFNSFNSKNLKSKQPMGHALSERSGHRQFLLETLQWLETVQPNSPRSLPCLSGWKMAIRSLLSLWQDLHNDHAFSYLLTDKLNQDCLENLFSRIRGNAGHVDNPSAQQLRTILRQVMVDQIFIHSEGSNCAEDAGKFLLNLKALQTAGKQLIPPPYQEATCQPGPSHDTSLHSDATFLSPMNDLAEKNVLTYISGFIARKMLPNLCGSCTEKMTGLYTGSNNEIFLLRKEYHDTEEGGLTVPGADLVHAVETLETVYKKNIGGVLHANTVKSRLTSLLERELMQQRLSAPQKCAN